METGRKGMGRKVGWGGGFRWDISQQQQKPGGHRGEARLGNVRGPVLLSALHDNAPAMCVNAEHARTAAEETTACECELREEDVLQFCGAEQTHRLGRADLAVPEVGSEREEHG